MNSLLPKMTELYCMKGMTKYLLAAISAIFSLSAVAYADPVTYTFRGIGSGDVDGVPFNNANFSIAVSADTAFIARGGSGISLLMNDIASTIVIDGFSLASFTGVGGNSVYVNNSTMTAGFSLGFPPVSSSDSGLLIMNSSTLGSYELSTSLDPVFDATPTGAANFVSQATSIGDVTFTSYQDATFSATVIPEPSGLVLLLVGAVGGWFVRRRLRR